MDTAMGLTSSQEIVDIVVPAPQSDGLQGRIVQELSQKPAHRIVSMSMATFGEYPTSYRVLVVIEYL